MQISVGIPWRGASDDSEVIENVNFQGFRALRLRHLRKWGQHYYSIYWWYGHSNFCGGLRKAHVVWNRVHNSYQTSYSKHRRHYYIVSSKRVDFALELRTPHQNIVTLWWTNPPPLLYIGANVSFSWVPSKLLWWQFCLTDWICWDQRRCTLAMILPRFCYFCKEL